MEIYDAGKFKIQYIVWDDESINILNDFAGCDMLCVRTNYEIYKMLYKTERNYSVRVATKYGVEYLEKGDFLFKLNNKQMFILKEDKVKGVCGFINVVFNSIW